MQFFFQKKYSTIYLFINYYVITMRLLCDYYVIQGPFLIHYYPIGKK